MSDGAETVQALAARWVLPVDRPPLADGVVVLRGGVIEQVTTRREFEQSAPAVSLSDYGDAVITQSETKVRWNGGRTRATVAIRRVGERVTASSSPDARSAHSGRELS